MQEFSYILKSSLDFWGTTLSFWTCSARRDGGGIYCRENGIIYLIGLNTKCSCRPRRRNFCEREQSYTVDMERSMQQLTLTKTSGSLVASTLLNVTLLTLVEEFSSLDFRLGKNSFILNHAIRDGEGESTFVMDWLFIRYWVFICVYSYSWCICVLGSYLVMFWIFGLTGCCAFFFYFYADKNAFFNTSFVL